MEKIFKALNDKTRIEILLLIANKPDICLCHIEEYFSLSNSNLSRHLKELEQAGLIVSVKIAKWKHYKINDRGMLCIQLIKKLKP